MRRILSFLLALVLVLSLAPGVSAADSALTSLTVVSRKTSTIAPGVTQDIVYSKLTNGEQMVYYTATVDVGQKDVHISAGYKDQDGSKWGLSKTTEQVKAATALHSETGAKPIEHYNIVAAINADFYDMVTGQPNGAFAIEGKIVQGANGKSFFAMRQDGTAVIGFGNSDWTKYNTADNPIVDAVGGGTVLVQNGVVKPTATADLNARTAIGIKENGEVVMLVTDGKQSPYSAGADMKHLAEILKDAGCVDAINLDGGGSTTYLAKQEGADKIGLVSKPCDGSERSTSTGLLVYTTIVPDDEFHHTALTPAHDYVTPGSTVEIAAVGVSATGASAVIPDDAVLQVKDSAMGEIKGGAFVSSGKTGDAVVQMLSGGKVVGEATIYVVVPETLSFPQDTISVPYGKTSPITVNAMYGLHAVTCRDGDITLTLSDAKMGTLTGSSFTACEVSNDAPTEGTLTASYRGGEPSVTANVNLGRGSEIVIDFDDPSVIDKLDWACESGHEYNHLMNAEWVNASTGKVHDGGGAVAFTVDLRQNTDYGGWQGVYLSYVGEKVPLTDAIGVGFWLWVPDEVDLTRAFIAARKEGVSGANSTVNGTESFTIDSGPQYDEGGWHYIYVGLDKNIPCNIKDGFLYIELRSHEIEYRLSNGIGMSEQNRMVWYVDSVTVDYSTVIDDRLAPKFDTVYLRPNVNDNIAMTRGAVTASSSGTVSFTAAVAEDTSDTNYTGLDESSAEAYIDGVPVSVSYANGALTTEEVTLAAGTHTLKMGISDNSKNYSSVIRQFRVSENANEPTIKLVPHDPAADRIPIGSVYYVDVVATDVTAIDKVEMDMDLNNISVWELANADVDYYFNYSYSVEPTENIGTVTLARKETEDRSGEAAKNVILASLPIRTWELNEEIYYGGVTGKANDIAKGKPMSSNGTKTYTPTTMWSSKQIWPTDISIEVDRGKITYAEGCTTEVMPSFSGDHIQVDTELFGVSATVKAAYPGKTRHHAHTSGEAQDKAATCTTAGYKGRVFCTDCKSPVTWGTTIPATGHKWAVAEDGENAGKMCCSVCGKIYTGELDGKTYKDGVVLDGWIDNSYYTDGVKQTDEFQEIEGKWYQFTDGVCEGKKPYTGFFTKDGARYYAMSGTIYLGDEGKDGWFQVEEEYCHACEGNGGALGKVTNNDNRTCVQAGYIFYNCSCRATKMSEALWEKGHTWDIENPQSGGPDPVCKVCETVGKDIGKLKVTFKGDYFVYTGNPIPAAYEVKDGDKTLSILSDKRGADGLATYSNHTNVGKGVLTIEGRGDYYGVLTGEFTIIPCDIPELRVKTQDKSSVTLEWDTAPGAEYYAVYQRPASGSDADWTFVKSVRETSLKITDLSLGQSYEFRAASRVTNPNDSDKPYSGANWTSVSVNLAHNWSDYTVVDATCTEDGSKTRTCSICGEEDVEILPALGHDVASWTTTKEPTISEAGSREGVCSRCEKTVTETIPSLKPYSIEVAECENGTVTTAPAGQAAEGAKITITAAPDKDYELNELEVSCKDEDGNTVSVPVEENSFTMPGADVTITASFTAIPDYTVTLPTGEGYTVKATDDSVSPLKRGGSYSFTVQLESGYVQKDFAVKANGEVLTPKGNVYTITDITANQTVTVEGVEKVEAKYYTITIPPDNLGYSVQAQQGSESPVKEGGYYIFSVQIRKGYTKTDAFAIKVNDVALDLEKAYFTDTVYLGSIFNIKENQVITVEGVEKVANSYTVTLPPVDPAYSLVANTGSTVLEDGNYSFTVTPNDGYVEGSGFAVTANGTALTEEDGVYTISGIRENQTVEVTGLVEKTYTVSEPTGGEAYMVQMTGNSEVKAGGSTSFVVLLGQGYYAADSYAVKVNGDTLTPDNFGIYTISNITADQSIEVTGVEELRIVPETAPPEVKVADNANISDDDKEELEKALVKTETGNVDAITKTEESTKELAKIVEKAIEALQDFVEEIKVKVGLDIQTTEYKPKSESNNEASIKLDIKPVYKVVQEVTDEETGEKTEVPVEANGKEIAGDLETKSFHEEMAISVPLPESFLQGHSNEEAEVIIKHYGSDGKEIVKDRQRSKATKADDGNWLINFKAKSFSEYEVQALSDSSSSIEVAFDTGKYAPIASQFILDTDTGYTLPVVEVNDSKTTKHTDTETNAIVTTVTTYEYEGWKFGNDVYTTLNDELFQALKDAPEGERTLVLSVTKDVTETTETIQGEELPELPTIKVPTTPSTPSGGGGGGASFSATVTVSGATGGKVSVDKTNAKAGDRVTVTATPDTGKEVDAVTVTDGNGKAVAVTDAGNGKYTFTMPDGEVTVKVTFKDETAAPVDKPSFTDVSADAYYADAVAWAVGKGIVNGTGNGCFSPNEQCTRAQIVTMLWRAAGCPEVETDAAFTDVSANSYYEKAVAWAVANGIVNGTGNDCFSPNDACTRAQAVTMLWRYEKQPGASGSSFNDVPGGAYYESAVVWAASTGVVNGTGNGRFSPNEKCTRAQIVTMLFRDMA